MAPLPLPLIACEFAAAIAFGLNSGRGETPCLCQARKSRKEMLITSDCLQAEKYACDQRVFRLTAD